MIVDIENLEAWATYFHPFVTRIPLACNLPLKRPANPPELCAVY
jgi:hypothetical protein